MSPDARSSRRAPGIVVGIGDQGLESYRAAVRLGAEEAALRQVPLRLVHGSRPTGQHGVAPSTGMELRQQRGRRLVNGAARELAATTPGRSLQILAESSPQTGTDLLLLHGRTAVMLVLQRGDGSSPTISAVTAAVGCPTLITRSGDRRSEVEGRGVGVLVVLDLEHDPASALATAFTEASLRTTAVTVLDGRGDGGAARVTIRKVGAEHPGVPVRYAEVEPVLLAGLARKVSRDAALLVVVRPDSARAHGRLDTLDGAACPVLVVAPLLPGG